MDLCLSSLSAPASGRMLVKTVNTRTDTSELGAQVFVIRGFPTILDNCGIDGGGCVPTSSKEKGRRCMDDLDNDCDGDIDGADSDCV